MRTAPPLTATLLLGLALVLSWEQTPVQAGPRPDRYWPPPSPPVPVPEEVDLLGAWSLEKVELEPVEWFSLRLDLAAGPPRQEEDGRLVLDLTRVSEDIWLLPEESFEAWLDGLDPQDEPVPVPFPGGPILVLRYDAATTELDAWSAAFLCGEETQTLLITEEYAPGGPGWDRTQIPPALHQRWLEPKEGCEALDAPDSPTPCTGFLSLDDQGHLEFQAVAPRELPTELVERLEAMELHLAREGEDIYWMWFAEAGAGS